MLTYQLLYCIIILYLPHSSRIFIYIYIYIVYLYIYFIMHEVSMTISSKGSSKNFVTWCGLMSQWTSLLIDDRDTDVSCGRFSIVKGGCFSKHCYSRTQTIIRQTGVTEIFFQVHLTLLDLDTWTTNKPSYHARM